MSEREPVTIHFLPEDVTVMARPGELLLDCAARAGIRIPTGCLMGSCHACEVDIVGQEPVCSCITVVPDCRTLEVHTLTDLLW